MDVYHKVLVKLYEVTGGKDSQTVEFKDLVRDLGFLGSYPDVFKELSRQGWIAETPRPDVVRITHWGVKEARKAGAGDVEISEAAKTVNRETDLLLANVKELSIIVDEFSADRSKENLALVETKFAQMKEGIDKIKENIE